MQFKKERHTHTIFGTLNWHRIPSVKSSNESRWCLDELPHKWFISLVRTSTNETYFISKDKEPQGV